jgi:hypothetical protein
MAFREIGKAAMVRDLLFHVTILWLVLGALLIATSSLVASRDREDPLTDDIDLDDDARDASPGESYGTRSPRIILASDLAMQTDRSEHDGPPRNDVGARNFDRSKSHSFQPGSNRLAY